MMTVKRRWGSLWYWVGICLGVWGCAWFQPVSKQEDPATDALWGDVDMEMPLQFLAISLPEPPPKPVEKPFFAHTVSRQGETLIAIARWYTGDGRNWVAIAEVNPTLAPKRIHIGDTIKIPKGLLITQKPLPRVKPAAKRRPPESPKRPKPKAIQVELFGPIVSTPSTGDTGRATHTAPLETID